MLDILLTPGSEGELDVLSMASPLLNLCANLLGGVLPDIPNLGETPLSAGEEEYITGE